MNERRQLTVGSLFSGIGGFDLGLERAGMRVIWQSEIDPYASAVLRRHWPTIPNLGDVRNILRPFWADSIRTGLLRPDVICGGFPCQPFSSAARGRNRDASLWPEMLRIISYWKPRWVCGENVAAINGMVLDEMVTDLEAIGYTVGPPLVIPACAVGHDHKRNRYWIIGYSDSHGKSASTVYAKVARLSRPDDDSAGVGTTHGISGGLDANRMRCLGNAIVPQIAEIIGRAIVEVESERRFPCP